MLGEYAFLAATLEIYVNLLAEVVLFMRLYGDIGTLTADFSLTYNGNMLKDESLFFKPSYKYKVITTPFRLYSYNEICVKF